MSGDITVATFAVAILTIAHRSRSYILRYFYLGFIYLAFALHRGFRLKVSIPDHLYDPAQNRNMGHSRLKDAN